MSEQRKKNEKNFLVQGSILAIAGVITKLIGAFYRIPLLNIIGTEGNGYYSVAFSIYSVALMLTSYSLPLAVSKLVSARVAVGEYKNAHKIFRGAITFALLAGGFVALLVFFGADFIATTIMHLDMSAYACIGTVYSDRCITRSFERIFSGNRFHDSDCNFTGY